VQLVGVIANKLLFLAFPEIYLPCKFLAIQVRAYTLIALDGGFPTEGVRLTRGNLMYRGKLRSSNGSFSVVSKMPAGKINQYYGFAQSLSQLGIMFLSTATVILFIFSWCRCSVASPKFFAGAKKLGVGQNVCF